MIVEYQKQQAHVQWWVGQYSFEQNRVTGDGGAFVAPEGGNAVPVWLKKRRIIMGLN